MTTAIAMERAAMGRGATDVATAVDELAAARAAADAQVGELLQGWCGEASEAFAAAYRVWQDRATELQSDLLELHAGLVQAALLLQRADDATSARMASVARLTGRLG